MSSASFAHPGNFLVVQSDRLRFEIAPGLAARVARMTFDGVDLLVSADVNPDNWGATYWTSPQADWGWPPVPEVDSLPYTAREIPKGWELKSSLAHIGTRRFEIAKRFVEGPHPGSIDTCYSIFNAGDASFSMANWEIARVPAGGLTFFPTGDAELTPIAPHHPLLTQKRAGVTFYEHADFVLGKSLKLHADGRDGFLAHATNDHLILKLFQDTSTEWQAPGEGECEIFANFDRKYVEIEVQGAYVEIEPGQSHPFVVRTVVLPLPADLLRSDYEGLALFAAEQARKYASPDLDQPWGNVSEAEG